MLATSSREHHPRQLVVSTSTARRLLDIGHTKFRELVKSGKIQMTDGLGRRSAWSASPNPPQNRQPRNREIAVWGCGRFISLAAPTIYAEPARASSTASRTQEVQQMTLPPFVIEDFVKVERNALRGFAKVRTPSGIIFHDVAIHRQADAAWASPASKPLLNRDGQHMKDASGKAQ
jgi:hypothetical protein